MTKSGDALRKKRAVQAMEIDLAILEKARPDEQRCGVFQLGMGCVLRAGHVSPLCLLGAYPFAN